MPKAFKQFLIGICALALAVVLFGCGGNGFNNSNTNDCCFAPPAGVGNPPPITTP